MIVFHERFLDHRQADRLHPESPERLTAILDRLKGLGLWREVQTPEPAPLEDVLRVHRKSYLDRLRGFGEGFWDLDTYVGPETFAIARLAAGGGILAAEQAWAEGWTVTALLRPPGHHATPGNAMGFCYLNNIAIAAARLLAEGKGPVAIVDLDVHHGNGTEEAFYASREVLFVSLHEFAIFPGTGAMGRLGEGAGKGFNVNIPLGAGCGDGTYELAMDRLVEPIVTQFKPAIVLVSFGADTHAMDPLANLTLSSPGSVHLVDRLRRLAKDLCQGRLALMLEGGYHCEALAEVMAGIVALEAGKKVATRFNENRDPQARGRDAIGQVAELQRDFWRV